MRLAPWRERAFPNLASAEYGVTSAETPAYNCIAWAAERTGSWWWPDSGGDYFWPTGVPREESLEAFIHAFKLAGYEPSEHTDTEPEFDRIAIYVDAAGVPTHAARQLASGSWTSKLGSWEDIEHRTLEALAGRDPAYGRVAVILRRPRYADRGNRTETT